MTLDEIEEDTGELAAMIRENAVVDPRTVTIRHSILKQMHLSAAHLWHACQQPQEDTLASRLAGFATDRKDALRFGTAVHLMLLGEGNKVAKCNIRRDARTKAFQAFQANAIAEGMREILSEAEHAKATAIVDSVRRHEKAMELLLDGTTREETIHFDFLGRKCRATPDARKPGIIVDLKTARSSRPDWFSREALKMFYPSQLAFYDEALEITTGRAGHKCFLVAVEKTPPYPTTVFELMPEVIELGKKQIRIWFEQLLVCEAANTYPAYSNAVVPIELDSDRAEWAA